MHTALLQRVERLTRITLPALGQSRDELLRLSRDDNAPLRSVVRAVERDPGLLLNLLRTINALHHRHLQNEVTTAEHGVMMLGLNQLAETVKELPCLDETSHPQLVQAILRAHHAAFQVHDWAISRKDLVPDELYASTMLHSVGEMLMWLDAPEQMERIEELIQHQGMAPEEAQYLVSGFELDQLSLALAEQWGLPSLLRDSLQAENANNKRIFGIMLALRLARVMENGWYTAEASELIGEVAEYLRVDAATAAVRIHEKAAKAARDAGEYPVTHVASMLLHPAGPEAVSRRAGAPAELCLVPQARVLRDILNDLQHPSPRTAQEVLSLALEAMHDGIGLNRVVFAGVTQDGMQLRARSVLGSEDPKFTQFNLDLDDHNLFSKLLKKPQAVWVNPDNQSRFLPYLPPVVRSALEADAFFLTSIFVSGKAIGIFYADHHGSACQLDGVAYYQFKQIAMAARQALERSLSRR